MKFRIGMRVRLVGVWHGIGPTPAGREATIIAAGPIQGMSGRSYEWELRVDSGFGLVIANSSELEPILDSDQSAEDTRALGRELLGRLKIGEGVPA